MALYRLIAGLWTGAIVLACAMAFVVICAAAWLVVILVGLLHPALTPRRACDWTRDLIRESVAHVRALG